MTTRKFLAISLIIIFVTLPLTVGTATAQVEVNGDFSGTLVGYGDDANDDAGDSPNQITVEGEITVNGENAIEPTVQVESGPSTVLDTSSVEVLVPGETAVEFDTVYGPDTVQYSTEEIPEGTTIEISYTVYLKGTDQDSIDAGNVVMEYESEGGTPGEQTYTAQTDTSHSAENVIAGIEGGEQIATWQSYLSYIGVAALIILPIWLVLKLRGGNDKPKP